VVACAVVQVAGVRRHPMVEGASGPVGAEVGQGERLEGAHCSPHLLMQLMHLSRLRMCMPFIRGCVWRTRD
jgi:hypothetical protein